MLTDECLNKQANICISDAINISISTQITKMVIKTF